jgi:hypothetical protein
VQAVLAHDSWQRLKRGRLAAAAVMAYKLATHEHTLPIHALQPAEATV